MAYTYVAIDLDDIDEDELIGELQARGHQVIKDGELSDGDEDELVQELYMRIIMKKPYDDLIRKFIWEKLGRIV